MKWSRTLTNLRDMLAGLYPTAEESRRVVVEAGLNPAFVSFSSRAITNWFNVLEEANKRDKVRAIVNVAQKDYPENKVLTLYLGGGDVSAIKGPDIEEEVMWRGPHDASELEKIIGSRNTLLPISFLEFGILEARSVVRVVRADGASGSGFLTGENLLITNHHVLPTADAAREALVQFNYQKTIHGLDARSETVRLSPQNAFVTSPTEEDDWTAVRVEGNPKEKWGATKLTRVDPQVQDHVNIIQHPGGGPKQVALYHNIVVFVDDKRLQYLTDTLPGSSGSPVYDSDWRVVALHHSGGWLREPGSKETYFRNEGIHINVIIEGLKRKDLYLE